MRTTIIGIDCATEGNKIGLALGYSDDSKAFLEKVTVGSSKEPVVKTIVEWMNPSHPTLLAFDAPLGWPKDLGRVLHNHRAGEFIEKSRGLLFRRETDRIVEARVRKKPFAVGADKIAHTAHSALVLLHELREKTGEIPLAREPGMISSNYAIEVYPAATLASYDPSLLDYKQKDKEDARKKVIDLLKKRVNLTIDLLLDPRPLERYLNALDAAICVLAGADFLYHSVINPVDLKIDPKIVEKEGWIWVLDPKKK